MWTGAVEGFYDQDSLNSMAAEIFPSKAQSGVD